MFPKTCPFFPDKFTNSIGGRPIDCPHTPCKFNWEETCGIAQGAALARDNYTMLQAICRKLGIN